MLPHFDRWLLLTLAGGGALLLLALLGGLCLRQPSRRARLAEWGLVAACLLSLAALAPAWLHLPATAPATHPVPAAAAPEPAPP